MTREDQHECATVLHHHRRLLAGAFERRLRNTTSGSLSDIQALQIVKSILDEDSNLTANFRQAFAKVLNGRSASETTYVDFLELAAIGNEWCFHFPFAWYVEAKRIRKFETFPI